MGGYGSGSHVHWWRPPRRQAAEECRVLSAFAWHRAGILRAGVRLRGTWSWRDDRTEAELASVELRVDATDDADPWARLTYAAQPSGERLDYRVGLRRTRPHFGGVRWWFACPGPAADGACGCRVGKLYLPPGAKYFGCRVCHRLTYSSSQDSRRFDRLWRTLAAAAGCTPDVLRRGMTGSGSPW